ncbi:unnamed protein product [Adineta ricciae]|uniref:Uncharacterized protein n=1 Tax=Adineta ricciae TaxID=249248 RepID=A0A813TH43_ADIRI|nr:unnamed protein product [Adineta ricciae]
MPRKQTTKRTTTTNIDDETEEQSEFPNSPSDEISTRIASIEEEVNRRFEEIERELDDLKTQYEKRQEHESKDDERFLKVCHALDYVLERMDYNYDTLACREMILTLLGQKTSRPFSGRTIRNRLLRRRIQRWCLGIVLILFLMACMSLYGLHRNWYYLLVVICLLGSLLSSIGLRRIYKIIETVW